MGGWRTRQTRSVKRAQRSRSLGLGLCSGPEPGLQLTGLGPMGHSAAVASWRRRAVAAPEPRLSNPGYRNREPSCRNCVHRTVYPETVDLQAVNQSACPFGLQEEGPGMVPRVDPGEQGLFRPRTTIKGRAEGGRIDPNPMEDGSIGGDDRSDRRGNPRLPELPSHGGR